MNKGSLVVLAIVAVAAVAAGVMIAGAGTQTGTEAPPDTGNNGTEGPRNYVVNVTDSIDVSDKS
jgi:archaellin